MNIVLLKNISLVGLHWGAYTREFVLLSPITRILNSDLIITQKKNPVVCPLYGRIFFRELIYPIVWSY